MVANVVYFLRGKEASHDEKKCAVYAEIVVEGKKCTAFSTRMKVPVKYWMTAGDKIIRASTVDRPVSASYTFADTINDELIKLRKLVDFACEYLESTSQLVTASAIRNHILNPKPVEVAAPAKTYMEVLDELTASLRHKRKVSTMKTYRTRRKNIHHWLVDTAKLDLLIADFKFQHFEDFQNYMTTCLNEDGSRQFAKNTINKHLTLINKVLNYGINKQYIEENPIGEMGLDYEKIKAPQYLLPLDRGRIYGCKMRTLRIERDIAVFLYNTGLAYTDYLTLAPSNIHMLESGERFIKKERDKTGVFSIIPVLDQAQEIIDRYGCIKKLPRPDISDLNKTLKILGEDCEAPFSLSTSTFRETFASMMENEYMMPERLLMFMMGHTNPRQLRNYSSVMPARILHELRKSKVEIPFNLSSMEKLVKAS